jgi:hypothetical protein
MMESVRGFRGEVVLSAELGRILLKFVNPHYVADGDHPDRLHPEDQLTGILSPVDRHKGARYPYPYFTKVLSTISADVDVLVDMKYSATGDKMWTKELPWEIKYQFLGTNRPLLASRSMVLTYFMIEIDGESFSTEVKKQVILLRPCLQTPAASSRPLHTSKESHDC